MNSCHWSTQCMTADPGFLNKIIFTKAKIPPPLPSSLTCGRFQVAKRRRLKEGSVGQRDPILISLWNTKWPGIDPKIQNWENKSAQRRPRQLVSSGRRVMKDASQRELKPSVKPCSPCAAVTQCAKYFTLHEKSFSFFQKGEKTKKKKTKTGTERVATTICNIIGKCGRDKDGWRIHPSKVS